MQSNTFEYGPNLCAVESLRSFHIDFGAVAVGEGRRPNTLLRVDRGIIYYNNNYNKLYYNNNYTLYYLFDFLRAFSGLHRTSESLFCARANVLIR